MRNFIYIILFSFIFSGFKAGVAQDVIHIQPLFEYPVAPEELESLDAKCDYLVKNFWNNFDFKKKRAIDQYALNEAFGVYVTSMRYASKKEVDQSVDKLISKISSNPALLIQFTKAAEFNLYGPRADVWIDDLYLKFVDAILKNKKISTAKKEKYQAQANSLRLSREGNSAPSFNFIDTNGEKKIYFPMSTPTILIFGDPDDTDWRLARLKMDTNFKLGEALEKGKINILYILTKDTDNWQQNVSNYNTYWTIGQSSDAVEKYDTRLNPSIYIIASDGKVMKKFPYLEEAIDTVLEIVN